MCRNERLIDRGLTVFGFPAPFSAPRADGNVAAVVTDQAKWTFREVLAGRGKGLVLSCDRCRGLVDHHVFF